MCRWRWISLSTSPSLYITGCCMSSSNLHEYISCPDKVSHKWTQPRLLCCTTDTLNMETREIRYLSVHLQCKKNTKQPQRMIFKCLTLKFFVWYQVRDFPTRLIVPCFCCCYLLLTPPHCFFYFSTQERKLMHQEKHLNLIGTDLLFERNAVCSISTWSASPYGSTQDSKLEASRKEIEESARVLDYM